MEDCSEAAKRIIRDLLDGTHVWPTWRWIDGALGHLQACSSCQADFPDAERKLHGMRSAFDDEVRSVIDEEHKSYLAAKYAAAASRDELAPFRALVALAASGSRIIDSMWSVNTSNVPFVGFLPSLTLENDSDLHDEIACARFGYWEFFGMLPDEEQDFVAAATMAWELSSDVRDHARKLLQGDSKEDAVASTPLMYRADIALLAFEAGARSVAQEYCRECKQYARRYTKQSVRVPALSGPLETAISDLRHELMADMQDFADSMKAGQMELIRAIETPMRIADDVEPFLREILGESIFRALDAITRLCLLDAEAMHRSRIAGHELSAAFLFAKAFELEFKTRLTRPLAQHLLQQGTVDYPAEGKPKLIRNRRFNDRFTPGQLLYLIRNDPKISADVQTLGLHIQEVLSTSDRVIGLRDCIVHEGFMPAHGVALRDLLLHGQALRMLFPRTGETRAAQT